MVFKLGLLFGCDVNNCEEEESELVSFQHKIIHEYIAALYITDQAEKDPTFLKKAFPDWIHVKNHIEVYRFCCGFASEQSKSIFMDYFIKTMVDYTSDMLRQGWDRPTHVYTYKGDTYDEREMELIKHSDTQELTMNLEEIFRECKGADTSITSNDIFVSNIENGENLSDLISTKRLLVFDEESTHYISTVCSGRGIKRTLGDENSSTQLKQGLLMDSLSPEKLQRISEASTTMANLKYVYLNKFEILTQACLEQLKRILEKPVESLLILHSKIPEEATDLAEALMGCVHLRVFNFWTTQGVSHSILKTVGNMKALTYFSVDGCDLDTKKCQTLCSELKHLSQLEVLELPYNNISHHGKMLSSAVKHWGVPSKLKRLDLVKCNMPSSVTGDLLKTLNQCCPDLYWLGLTGNDLQDNIHYMVKSESKLRKLFIGSAHLTSKDIFNLAKSTEEQKLLALDMLDISNNDLNEESLLSFVGTLKYYHTGQMLLNIGRNKLKEETLRKRILKSRQKVKIIVDK